MVLYVTVPAMAGLILLREPIISILFERGEFDHASVRLTGAALLYYGSGIWAIAASRIVVFSFNAVRDVRTPFKCALVCVFVKIALSVVLVHLLDFGGLALSTSLASVLNFVILAKALAMKFGIIKWKEAVISFFYSITCTTIMALGVIIAARLIIPPQDAGLVLRLGGLFGCIFFGIVIYIVISMLLKCKELRTIFQTVKPGGGIRD
jgi:putative peptidoglycan lipid II flippase